MNILVTGGSGFIGTVLVKSLIAQGHTVTIYDKLASIQYPEYCIIGDVRDRDALVRALTGMETVYHLAAEHRDDVTPPSLYYDVNVGGAKNLVVGCVEQSVNRIIFTSSVALYGLNIPSPDEETIVAPFNDYGRSKYESELIFQQWVGDSNQRSLTIIRPSVIFGEGNRGNVYNLIKQVAEGRFVMVGDGKNCKSMGYIGNITAFLSSLADIDPGYEVFNFADKPDMTAEDLITTVSHALGKKKPLPGLPFVVGLIGGYCFDFLAKATGRKLPISSVRIRKFCASTQISTEKLQQTNFIAPYTLKQGIERFIAYDFKKNYLNP